MIRTDYPFGFRVVGPVTETRRLVNATAAFSGQCAADPKSEPHREAYLSAFQFGGDFRDHLQVHGTPKGFTGPCWSPWLWLDLDRPDDLDAALGDARRLAGSILERYSELDEDDPLYFFSGGKGYHLGIPLTFNPDPSRMFHRIARRLAEGLAASAGVRIDPAIYDRVRCFRAPNSKHPKTGLHKRRLVHAELFGLNSTRIAEMAREPASFAVPQAAGLAFQLAADWNEAAGAIDQGTAVRCSDHHPGRLQRATREFLSDGAEDGERHTRLFRAAADMAELAKARGVDGLIVALLTEPALDTGLPPSDVDRQIRSGIDHAQRQTQKQGGAE